MKTIAQLSVLWIAATIAACAGTVIPENEPPPPDCRGMTLCGGLCVDVHSDGQNCGGCGTACSAGQVCATGKCAVSCPGTLAVCSGGCVDTQNDPRNCGGCGTQCAAPANGVAACAGGKCVYQCKAGFDSCDGMPGCNIALASDVSNCGKCGNVCPPPANATAACANSMCGFGMCNMGFADCNKDPSDGCEVETDNDPMNCGMCAMACPKGASCKASMCVCPGMMGAACNNVCTDLASDNNNCGKCGNACMAPTPTCVNGQCSMFDPTNCATNPEWQPVNCTTTQWDWSSDETKAKDVSTASQLHILWVGCQHANIPNTCSLTGQGWVSTKVFTMSGCNQTWWHLGGSYTGQCGGHDGDQIRHLAMGSHDCYNY